MPRKPRLLAGFITEAKAEHVLSLIRKTDTCWFWTKAVNRSGYGVCSVWDASLRRCVPYFVHRIAYFLHTGIDPLGKFVCHTCDNPPCCNPEHLFIGDQKANMSDAARKGRTKRPAWAKRERNCKLTPETVRRIRERIAAGERQCDLAREYGVNRLTINRAVSGRSWPTVV